VIVAVPEATPVTRPEGATVAINGLLLFQVPPDGDAVNKPDMDTHNEPGPEIAAADAFTVTDIVEKQPGPIV